MTYKPGLHILLTVNPVHSEKLCLPEEWMSLIKQQVEKHGLMDLGAVRHSFESGGFTAVHCLTESHISIHTWPEFNVCTCDIFLSNFMRDNSSKVKAISEAIIDHFGSGHVNIKEISR
jgi:S-adenosylmethionine decarboxylase